ncbi:PKD domain-containing protein [uncultured Polaribacter sp.]|uniref:LamG domain-containing protein n=1 Tax=uncultured Polaribacter sp. TaxID=174711 RepID=UPI0026119061|nr:PKD domain-containing protein [uncultured Polaribacter sp.]
MKNKIFIMASALLMSFFYACDEDDIQKSNIGVDFKADTQNISANEEVSYTDLSIGDISKWDWTFEGGTPPTSNLQSPTITYEAPGSYNVTLKVGNSVQSETLTKESFITVSASEVVADFSASDVSAIQNENVVFTDLSTGSPTSWNWEFIPKNGSTITSTEQNPVIAFSEATVYSVRLTASNQDNSDEVVKADFINVIDVTSIDASFQTSAKNTYTSNTVTFTDTSVGTSTNWSWTFEGGTPATSNLQNPTVVYETPGKYRVSFTASNTTNSSEIVEEDFITVIPGDDLAGYFPLDGNANDFGPNSIDHNVMGTVNFTGTDRHMNENGTAVFDGSGHISITDNDAMNFGTDNFTIGVWFKTNNTSRMMVYQESGKNGGGDNQAWFRLNDNTDSRVARAAVEDPTGGAILNIPLSALSGILTDDKWHFATFVREGDDSRLYIDGSLIGARTGAFKDVSNEQNFSLGAQASGDNFSNYYMGELDDLMLYRRALSETEVSELFNL